MFCFSLVSCGYEPMYSKKKIDSAFNFSISSIGFSGENNINKNLKNNLKNFIDIDSKPINYDITIDSAKIITTTSKNKKGDPEIFYMKIIINIEVFQNNKTKIKKTLEDGFEYKNKSNKFELKQYEETISKNIVTKLSEEIIEELYSIK